jgi:transposase
MTKEEMLELAKRAGWLDADVEDGFEPLWKFAKLIAEKEREICADFVAGWTGPDGKHGCAKALRINKE